MMRNFTKCLVILDVVFQLLLFASHLGVLIWNDLHADVRDKYFPEIGNITLFVGIASALPSLELDVFLMYFLEWRSEVALFRWNFACLGFAFGSWCSYIAVTVYIENLYVSVWAFFYMYTRATLIMVAKTEYLEMAREPKKSTGKKMVSRYPFSADLTFASTESTPMMPYREPIKTSEESRSAIARTLDFEDCELEPVNTNGENLTFCTFLGTNNAMLPDHYMACDKPVIKANEEKKADDELKTTM